MAISPQTQAKNAEVKQKHRLEFAVLSDPGLRWTSQLSLNHRLPADLQAVYEQFGILLPEYNGDDSWQLPMPARLIVGPGGTIRGIEANPDYTHRPEPESGLQLLRGLACG